MVCMCVSLGSPLQAAHSYSFVRLNTNSAEVMSSTRSVGKNWRWNDPTYGDVSMDVCGQDMGSNRSNGGTAGKHLSFRMASEQLSTRGRKRESVGWPQRQGERPQGQGFPVSPSVTLFPRRKWAGSRNVPRPACSVHPWTPPTWDSPWPWIPIECCQNIPFSPKIPLFCRSSKLNKLIQELLKSNVCNKKRL